MGINECAFAETADKVYCEIYRKLDIFGHVVFGRNGETKELTHVCMSIDNPLQRWVVSRKPMISPAFAIAELIMIMNGSDEAELLNVWNPVMNVLLTEGETIFPVICTENLQKSSRVSGRC